MDPAGLGFGVVATVIQVYTAVSKAYDLYIGISEFPDTYGKLRMALLIERYRLELFKDHVLSISEEEKLRIQNSPRERSFWKLLELIFGKILETFNRSSQLMERIGGRVGLPEQGDNADWELIDSLSLSLKAKPSSTLNKIKQTMHTGKFVLRNKSKMEQTIKELKSWNDSLDSMTEKLTRESSRRQLRSQFSTNDTQKLEQLVAAARFLEHWDIERMASARTLIESFKQEQVMESPIEVRAPSRTQLESKYAFQMKEFEFQGNPFPSDIVRATAWFKGERVIVDWRCCEDDTWRIDNPLAFRQRTESLTKILNSDLEPLNLSILHCLGYFDQNKHITGYAFKPPPGASEKDRHTTLQDALKNLSGFDDVPDVGDRFRLAKALASTLFEIHNLGWIHKNIQPVNILFWPKKGGKELPCVSKPYLMGFDISRPNQPGEMTEKPPFRLEDDIYRHPEYKDREATSFQPSFDVYSLGVVLWEIGLWRKLGGSRQRPSVGSKDLSQWPDRNLINNMIERGEINHLKRFAGTRYRDAVAACFNPDLDAIWKGEVNGDREQKLRRHLDIVRRDIVDVLASCNA